MSEFETAPKNSFTPVDATMVEATNGKDQVTAATEHDKEDEKTRFHFFWETESPFSQWHRSRYTLNGFSYSCAEQGMMHGKALLFDDQEVAALVLQTNNPRKIKSLGRKVQGFDEKVWEQNRWKIVYENSVAKFTQNAHMRKALLSTQPNCLLVEASPSDRIWGIGLVEAEARQLPPSQWKGLNLLGQILTQVRDEIATGMHNDCMIQPEHNDNN